MAVTWFTYVSAYIYIYIYIRFSNFVYYIDYASLYTVLAVGSILKKAYAWKMSRKKIYLWIQVPAQYPVTFRVVSCHKLADIWKCTKIVHTHTHTHTFKGIWCKKHVHCIWTEVH